MSSTPSTPVKPTSQVCPGAPMKDRPPSTPVKPTSQVCPGAPKKWNGSPIVLPDDESFHLMEGPNAPTVERMLDMKKIANKGDLIPRV